MRKNLFRLALALCLSLPVVVQANPVFPSTTSGNTTSYGEGTYSAATYATAAVATIAGTSLAVEYRTQIATAAGAVFPVVTRALPSTAAIAGAARYCFANVACYGTVAGAAAIATIGAHYGFGVEASPTGPTFTKKDPSVCTQSPCYEWKVGSAISSEIPAPTASTAYEACRLWAVHPAKRRHNLQGQSGTTCFFDDDGYPFTQPVWRTEVPPINSAGIPASVDDVAKAIENSSTTDNPASIDSKKTIIQEAAKTGYTIPLSRPTSIDVPKSVITQNPTYADLGGGKTKTTTKSTSLTCTPPDCVAIETTIEQVKDLGVGATTTTTTETPADVVQDVPLSDVPKLYKRKYENGIVDVWTEKKAELSSSGLGSLAQAMMPNIGASGGCPVFSIPAQIGPLSFGSGFSGPPCYIWDFCKVVVLLGAAFLARALVFGG